MSLSFQHHSLKNSSRDEAEEEEEEEKEEGEAEEEGRDGGETIPPHPSFLPLHPGVK